MKVIATTLAASAVAVQIGTKPLRCEKDWSELPAFAQGYAQSLTQSVCQKANLGEQEGCSVHVGGFQEALCELMSAPECPATDFSKEDCKKCYDGVTENKKTWMGLSAAEKAWLDPYMSRNAHGQTAYDVGTVLDQASAIATEAKGTGPRDVKHVKAIKGNRGSNNDLESMEENMLFQVETEAYICALRIAAADGCGTKVQQPTVCTP